MQISVDNQIARLLAADPVKIQDNPFLFDANNCLRFRWPSLLEYLGLGSILSDLPAFDQNQPLFEACIATLSANEEPEVVLHLYDRLFTENLKQVMALEQIEPSFLLQAIKKQRQTRSFFEVEPILSPALAAFETRLTDHASPTRHDLILYLAWDRMCVWMARLFDYQSTDLKFIEGIRILRECLIESYQHIAQQGRTIPGLYRMLEAFLFYEMREENLQKLTTPQWTILSQSFQTLKGQDELIDFFYIDDADSECYLTLDSPGQIDSRLSFAQCMIDKIKSEVPSWDYPLRPKQIAYLEL